MARPRADLPDALGLGRLGQKAFKVKWLQKRSLSTRIFHGFLLALALGLVAALCPTPYYLRAPGPTFRARDLVHVEGARIYPSRGNFLLMTVVAEPATILSCLYSLFDPAAELTTRTSEPQAQAGADQDAWQMTLSQSVASDVAMDYVLQTHPEKVRGLRVIAASPGGPNQAMLKPDDLLVALEGQPVRHMRDIAVAVQRRPAGSSVLATVERKGKPVQVPLRVWQNGPRRMLGFRFMPMMRSHGGSFNIHIDSERVGGASGGLVFCLELIDQLTDEDITAGRTVAATGTLDRQARVGPIEGVRFKKIAAERAGASLFLCPRENLVELKDEPASLEVVGVDSLGEALEVLRAKSRR